MEPRDPLRLARDLADALESAGSPYAIGGALSFAYWGPPRGTQDVDLNVFLWPDRVTEVDRALDAIASAGVTLDRAAAWHEIRTGGYVRGWDGRTAVDAFFNSIPLHDAAFQRRVSRPMLGRPAWVLSAEDLTVLKLMFFRGKDLVDVERLVALQAGRLDHSYVRGWLVDLVGGDDHRVETWDRILAELNEPPKG